MKNAKRRPADKIIKILFKVLPHVNIIISGMYITFFILDFNHSQMVFINNLGMKILLAILSLCSVICSAILIAWQRRSM